MKTRWFVRPRMMFAFAGLLCAAALLFAEPSAGETGQSNKDASPVSDAKGDDGRVSVNVARDRAKLMHEIYAATLDVMHHRYFHRERAVVPARALEDVFSEMKRQSKSEAQWISVNMKAMSIDHEPRTAFEKKAAEEIAAGKSDIEVVEDGYFRRAGAILLADGCINCHGGFFKETSNTPKYAGLVISVPILREPRAAPSLPPPDGR